MIRFWGKKYGEKTSHLNHFGSCSLSNRIIYLGDWIKCCTNLATERITVVCRPNTTLDTRRKRFIDSIAVPGKRIEFSSVPSYSTVAKHRP